MDSYHLMTHGTEKKKDKERKKILQFHEFHCVETIGMNYENKTASYLKLTVLRSWLLLMFVGLKVILRKIASSTWFSVSHTFYEKRCTNRKREVGWYVNNRIRVRMIKLRQGNTFTFTVNQ